MTHPRTPVLIPAPRVVRAGQIVVPFGGAHIVRIDPEIADFATAAAELLTSLGDEPGPLVAQHEDRMPREGYRLSIRVDGSVHIAAADSLGVLHAIQTLRQWAGAMPSQTVLPVEIEDWPDMAARGVFVESFWGSDLMTLADWCELIDRFSALKLNTVALSVYGCWDLRHDRDRGEYLFLPLDEFPELRTPHRFTRWNPETQEGESVEYLPKMFEDDFFGDVVAYAQNRGVEVIPFIAGPGHSSLLPRLMPELSAVDDRGEPVGYGYCLSNPVARAALERVLHALLRQHIAGTGIRRVGIQGDEFFPIRNVDPDDPLRAVSPYCRCAGCATQSPGELLLNYLELAGSVTAEYGVGMVHWNDSLEREGVLNAYAAALSDVDRDVTVSWWGYNDPLPTVRTSSAWQTWVTPTPGLIASMLPQDFTLNIEQWVRVAHEVGAAGVVAYNTYTPSNVRNYAALADLSWNFAGSGGRAGFLHRWSRAVGVHDPARAELAGQIADSVLSSYPLMNYLLQQTLPYFAAAAAGQVDYVPDLLSALSAPFPALESVVRQSRDTVRAAETLMPPLGDLPGWPELDAGWRSDAERIIRHLDLVVEALLLARRAGGESAPALADDLAEWERRGRRLLDDLVAQSPDFLAPVISREHWGLVAGLRPALEAITSGQLTTVNPNRPWHAWLF